MTERSANRKGCIKQVLRGISKHVVLPVVSLDGLGAVAKNPQIHFLCSQVGFRNTNRSHFRHSMADFGGGDDSRANVRNRVGHNVLTTALKFLTVI